MVELLKEGQYHPYHVADQVISIFAGTQGLLDDMPISRIAEFEERLLLYIRDEHPELRNELIEAGDLGDSLAGRLREIIGSFKKSFLARSARHVKARTITSPRRSRTSARSRGRCC